MTTLKSTIGIVSDNADDMIKNSKQILDKLKIENNRHAVLLKSQSSLQLMYISNHLDDDQNLVFDEIELKYAKQSILSILPNLNWNVVIPHIKNTK